MSNSLEEQPTKEVYTPSIAADFEEGDRVYTANGLNKEHLGTVQEVHDTWLSILMDDGEWKNAQISLFDRNGKNWCWQKVLDLNRVEKGTEISRRSRRGRVFASVVEYIPNESIVLGPGRDLTQRQFADLAPIKFSRHHGTPLEEYLVGWEVED